MIGVKKLQDFSKAISGGAVSAGYHGLLIALFL